MFIFKESVERALAAVRMGQHVRIIGKRLSGRTTILRGLITSLESSGVQVIQATGGNTLNGQIGYAIDQVAAAVNTELGARSVFSMVEALSQEITPGSVLALDNVHNMDALSLQVISEVRERIGIRIASTELVGRSRVADLSPVWPETLIWVPDLDLTSCALLAHHVLGGPVDTRLLSLVYSKSGGNAGLVVALLESARSAGLTEKRNGVWISTTGYLWNEHLSALLDGLLCDLSEDERNLLISLATEGPLSIEVLQKRSSDKTLRRLFELRFITRVGYEEPWLAQVWPLILSARFQRANPYYAETLPGKNQRAISANSSMVQPAHDPSAGSGLAYLARTFANHERTTIDQSFRTWQAEPTTSNALRYLDIALGSEEERLNILNVFNASLSEGPLSDRNDVILYYRYTQWLLLVERDREQATTLIAALAVTSNQWSSGVSSMFRFLEAFNGAPVYESDVDDPGEDVDDLCHSSRLGLDLIRGDLPSIREKLAKTKNRPGLKKARTYIEPAVLSLEGRVKDSIELAEAYRKDALTRFDRVSYLNLSYTIALGALYLGDDQLLSNTLSEASIIGRPGIVFSPVYGAILTLKAMESNVQGHPLLRDDLLREAKAVSPMLGPFLGMGAESMLGYFELDEYADHFDQSMAEHVMRRVNLGYYPGAIQSAVMALTSQWGSQIVVALEKAFDVAPLGAYTNIVQAARLLEDGNAQAANDWARTLPEYAEEWHLLEQLWGSAIRNAAHYDNHSYATELQSGFPRELAPRALEGSEPENTSIDRLSKRERQVGLLAEELSNPEIAERLHISKRTVENHISNALRKTESRDRVELSGRIRTAFPNSGD